MVEFEKTALFFTFLYMIIHCLLDMIPDIRNISESISSANKQNVMSNINVGRHPGPNQGG